ncbi:MAG: PKD domain-containing protein [Bacteroidetes bacterium]|nr:PKD domain-containing protein [Bacteroidota bacterium]
MILTRRFIFLIFCCLLPAVNGIAQGLYRKALFLGNSYTYVNNLPGLTAALAHSAGDSLFFDSNTPGGYTLGWQPIAHSTDSVSLAKIRETNWDFVILQEQSQTPAIPVLRDSCMFPGATTLHDSVKSVLPCARVLFFLTWGRRFGGIQCFVPNYCSTTFAGFNQMQDSLTTSYKMVADSLHDWIAPAGEAWRLVIGQYGMVLHDIDDSHPNLNGSYLTACVFYDCTFGKPSAGLTFTAGLQADSALLLQQAADSIVFGYVSIWNLWNDHPKAGFSTQVTMDTLFTHNTSLHASEWVWDFGDGETSNDFEPVHIYHQTGNYPVTLQACDSCRCDTSSTRITILYIGFSNPPDDKESVRLVGPIQGWDCYFKGYTDNGVIEIYDLTGKEVLYCQVISGKFTLNHLSHGTYFWHLRDQTGQRKYAGKLLL